MCSSDLSLVCANNKITKQIALDLFRARHAQVVEGYSFIDFADILCLASTGQANSNAVLHYGSVTVEDTPDLSHALRMALGQLRLSASYPLAEAYSYVTDICLIVAVPIEEGSKLNAIKRLAGLDSVLESVFSYPSRVRYLEIPIIDETLRGKIGRAHV